MDTLLHARSRKPYAVYAFGHHEYVPYEFRPVPQGYERAAETHTGLETKQGLESVLSDVDDEKVVAHLSGADAAQAADLGPQTDDLSVDLPPITPKAQKIADDNGLNIRDITGTGADGRILVGDVRDAIRRKAEDE